MNDFPRTLNSKYRVSTTWLSATCGSSAKVCKVWIRTSAIDDTAWHGLYKDQLGYWQIKSMRIMDEKKKPKEPMAPSQPYKLTLQP